MLALLEGKAMGLSGTGLVFEVSQTIPQQMIIVNAEVNGLAKAREAGKAFRLPEHVALSNSPELSRVHLVINNMIDLGYLKTRKIPKIGSDDSETQRAIAVLQDFLASQNVGMHPISVQNRGFFDGYTLTALASWSEKQIKLMQPAQQQKPQPVQVPRLQDFEIPIKVTITEQLVKPASEAAELFDKKRFTDAANIYLRIGMSEKVYACALAAERVNQFAVAKDIYAKIPAFMDSKTKVSELDKKIADAKKPVVVDRTQTTEKGVRKEDIKVTETNPLEEARQAYKIRNTRHLFFR